MQAVILAGGLGSRLWPLTKTVPKPMVPVAGVPYLKHQLTFLRQQGVCDVVLLTGYLGEQIEEYFGDGRQLDLSISYSRETTPLGTGGALRAARHLLADSFLLVYGDSYLPINYRELSESLLSTDAVGVLVVYDNRISDTAVKNNVAIDSGLYVIRYEKDSADPSSLQYVDAGVQAFRQTVLDYFPDQEIVSLEKDVFSRLIGARQLLASVTRQRFYDIGTPQGLSVLEEVLR